MTDPNYYIRIEGEIAGKVILKETISCCELDIRVRMIRNIITSKAGGKPWAVFVRRMSSQRRNRGLRAPQYQLRANIDKIIATKKLVLPLASPSRQRR